MSKTANQTVGENASKKVLQDRTFLLGLGKRLSPKEWEDAKRHFDKKCVYCGKPEGGDDGKGGKVKLQKDHAIPMSVKHLGMDRCGNVVPACAKCNSNKGARNYVTFCRHDKIAIRGTDAERDIKKYMNDMGYKGLPRKKAKRTKIREIITDAHEQIAKIRDDAVKKIKEVIAEK